jgi:hypothetical protein
MVKRSIPLKTISVAAPCSADWEKMIGDEKVRFCKECKLNVYNLSALTEMQAEDLIRKTEGRLCVRYFRRADGTVLTQNCPVGLQAIKKKVARTLTAVVSAFLSFVTGFGLFSFITAKKTVSPVMGEMVAPPINLTPPKFDGEIKGEMVINPGETPNANETPVDELANSPFSSSDSLGSSGCSVKEPDMEGVIMGKIALPPLSKGNSGETDDIEIPGTVERSEEELLNALIESPEIKISNKNFKGQTLKVVLNMAISGGHGMVVSAQLADSDKFTPKMVKDILDAFYKWKFDVNKLNNDGAHINGILTVDVKVL